MQAVECQSTTESDEGYKQIIDLQVQNEHLHWQKSIIEAEKLQCIFENKEISFNQERQNSDLQALEIENQALHEQVRTLQTELTIKDQGQSTVTERERDNLKELIAKLQSEKERL